MKIKLQDGKIEFVIIVVAFLLSLIAGYCIAEGAICLIDLLEREKEDELHTKRLVFIPVECVGESESKSDDA